MTRAITTAGLKPPAASPNPGPAPMLQWIDIELLVVEPGYQREIRAAGLTNIAAIAAAFHWSCFSPVIVSPIAGGKLAIVDGQHRTTAAALLGYTQVPCQVIIADHAQQARAFAAINATVTKMSAQQVFAARIEAGDAGALALKHLAWSAGVTLLRYPKGPATIQPGETMAVKAVARVVDKWGGDILVRALRCVTETSNNVPGALPQGAILTLARLLAEYPAVAALDDETLFAAMDRIELEQVWLRHASKVRDTRVESHQTAVAAELADLVLGHVEDLRGAAAERLFEREPAL